MWPAAARVNWLQTAANIFDLIYKGEGGINGQHGNGESIATAAGMKRDRQLGGLTGRKVMDWLNGKSSIAGIQIPNWAVILGAAVIVILLIYTMGH
jgi:hypothetical protein